MNKGFSYAAEKLSAARRSLMLPHSQGEAGSIASSFHECSLGLKDIQDEDLDDFAREWVAKIKELMDTKEISDPSDRGAWHIKAEQLTVDQQYELSRSVDELAFWFKRNS